MSGMTDERRKEIENGLCSKGDPEEDVCDLGCEDVRECLEEIDRLNALRDQVTELIRQLKAEKEENRNARELLERCLRGQRLRMSRGVENGVNSRTTA